MRRAAASGRAAWHTFLFRKVAVRMRAARANPKFWHERQAKRAGRRLMAAVRAPKKAVASGSPVDVGAELARLREANAAVDASLRPSVDEETA